VRNGVRERREKFENTGMEKLDNGLKYDKQMYRTIGLLHVCMNTGRGDDSPI
jgi:hypothetical protein